MATENLSLDKIRPNENQPRRTFYQESLEELAASIKERGVLQPIVVRPATGKDKGLFEIVMGERRYRACKMLGLDSIPAIVRDLNDEDAATDALLENYQREDMNVIEKARAIQGLLQHMSYEKISRTLGVSETTVRRTLELLELPISIQQELVQNPAKGALFQEGHARVLLSINEDTASQLRLVEKVKAEKLNISDVEKIISAIRQFPNKKEAFLRVPVSVTEQMLRSLGAREERKKPYKSQTAEQHLKSIEKQASVLGDMLDERIGEFLSAEHMNQLLATTVELQRDLESFNSKIRESLATKDFGFREVYIHCPLCGRVELIGSVRCSVCWTILRRCYDCGNYDRNFEKCGVTGGKIFIAEAESPKEHSKSYRCPMYKPKFDTQPTRLKMAA
ncbi:ParB/RepB/Spo0J family partition protein [Armatimonas sp.]|uniref:ParB/RepB/Spo0J family partition protein n=1 Tax=Armatimonas sp. TaxID=1872638 RepID=UPI00286B1A4A|nr:ParB/RepB/Spo0J family partition protein [Armatimonas sp.]